MTTFYKHIHCHEEPRCPAVTLMAVETEDGHVKMSWSVCSSNDNFCRKIGRIVAERNMIAGRYVVGRLDSSVSMYENLVAILETADHLKDADKRYWNQAMEAIMTVEEEKTWLDQYMDSLGNIIRGVEQRTSERLSSTGNFVNKSVGKFKAKFF